MGWNWIEDCVRTMNAAGVGSNPGTGERQLSSISSALSPMSISAQSCRQVLVGKPTPSWSWSSEMVARHICFTFIPEIIDLICLWSWKWWFVQHSFVWICIRTLFERQSNKDLSFFTCSSTWAIIIPATRQCRFRARNHAAIIHGFCDKSYL